MTKDDGLRRALEALQKAFQVMGTALKPIAESSETLDRYRAARALSPDDPKAEPWSVLIDADLTVRQLRKVESYFPDPRARRGRPKGDGPVSTDEALFADLEERVAAGERPTTAAKALLVDRGVDAGLKGKADHLVRAWRKKREIIG